MTEIENVSWNMSNVLPQLIAVCQIIFSLIGLFSLGAEMSSEHRQQTLLQNAKDNGQYWGKCKTLECRSTLEEINDAQYQGAEAIKLIWCLLSFEVISFCWSIVLFLGVILMGSGFIKSWIRFTMVKLLLWTGLFIALQCWRSWDGGILMNATIIFSTCSFHGFSIWVVKLVQLEIDNTLKSHSIEMRGTP